MAVILGKLVEVYYYLNYEISDPRTENWFLIKTPFLTIGIISIYLYTVFNLGPKFMSNRPAYSLKIPLIIYNIIQIFSSSYMVYQSIVLGWANNYKLICEPVDTSNNPIAIKIAWRVCYLYFIVKIVDLLDTIFFILRKKTEQLSFLHIYHHAGMVVLSWCIVKWLPGGHGVMLITINSFVHSVMYSYYLLATDESNKQYLWWKKYVTQLQIIQFGYLFFHFLAVFFVDCRYPKIPSFFLLPQNLFFVYLFTDFYIKTYLKKKNV